MSGFSNAANSPRYNDNKEPVYPTGIDLSNDGDTLFVANNLADNLGIVRNLRGERKLERVELNHANNQVYPYDVIAGPRGKVYVSLWNDASVAVVDLERRDKPVSYITVGAHPTSMIANSNRTRIFVANSDGDSVSVIDTLSDRELERINVRLSEDVPPGNSPEGLALAGDELYVANAHSNSVAVVELSEQASGKEEDEEEVEHSKVRGFIPTGQYPSAIAVAGKTVFVGNGKGTGLENSSVLVKTQAACRMSRTIVFPRELVAAVAPGTSTARHSSSETSARFKLPTIRRSPVIHNK